MCRGSGGAGVTHQPEPRNPSAGADVSRIRRNQTFLVPSAGIGPATPGLGR